MSIYDQFGVRPTINAWGTVTEVGGSLMDRRVLDAMLEAAGAFVDVVALHEEASRRIADDLGVEAALITSGAAAGVSIATAGCLTGSDPAAALGLPRVTGPRTEVALLARHRTAYEQQIRLAGATLVLVGDENGAGIDDVLAAVGPRTAMFFHLVEAAEDDAVGLPELHAALAPLGIPVVADAAGELPLPGQVRGILEAGADLVILSGGKELRGPQSSGIVAGRRDLIDACALNAFPHESIGRGMKVDKETIVGLATAVGLYVARDEEAIARDRTAVLAAVAAGLAGRDDVTVTPFEPSGPGLRPPTIPRLAIRAHRVDARTLRTRLLDGTPRVAVGSSERGIEINPQCLDLDEVPLLVEAIAAALDGAGQPATPADGQARDRTAVS